MWCYSSFLWFCAFFGGKAIWEGGYHRKMVICANLMWIWERRIVFIISKCSRKFEHCIETAVCAFLFSSSSSSLYLSLDDQYSKLHIQKKLHDLRAHSIWTFIWDDAWWFGSLSSNFDDNEPMESWEKNLIIAFFIIIPILW